MRTNSFEPRSPPSLRSHNCLVTPQILRISTCHVSHSRTRIQPRSPRPGPHTSRYARPQSRTDSPKSSFLHLRSWKILAWQETGSLSWSVIGRQDFANTRVTPTSSWCRANLDVIVL